MAGRARRLCLASAALAIVLFAGAGAGLAFGIDGYRISGMPDAGSAFLPVAKTVARAPGAWLDNYRRWPWAWSFPAAAFAGAALTVLCSARRLALQAFLCSALALGGVALSAGAVMFPFILPSSLSPDSSLTAWDAAASHGSLMLLFWVTAILMPVVAAYTAWVYRVLRGPVTPEQINRDEAY
jgi:cytochrome d ubiquinol oxidase subunit II